LTNLSAASGSAVTRWGTSASDGHPGQFREPPTLRLIDQGAAVQVQQIEPQGDQRQLGADALHLELSPEAAHRRLERLRPAVRKEAQDFPVEDQIAPRQSTDRLDDLRRSIPL